MLERGRRTIGSKLGFILLCGCDPAYPIAPTACDDWCFATQRAGCEEDYPEGCVSECEDSSTGRTYPQCEAPWLELIDCYRAAPDTDFRCVDDASRPGPICREKRTALAECVSPAAGSCVASCLREVAECGSPERDCEGECQTPTAGCESEDRALHECRLAAPVRCEGSGDDSSDELCLDVGLLLLQCAGYFPMDGMAEP